MSSPFPTDPLAPVPVSDEADDSVAQNSFADILSEFEHDLTRSGSAAEGASLSGVLVTVGEDAVLVDIGRKLEGALPLDAVRDATGAVAVKPGDSIIVTVTGRHPDGFYLLSKIKVVVPKDWTGLQKAFDEKATITGTVEQVIKGGLRVDVGARAFLPASRSGVREVADLEKLVGTQIECRITKLDTENEDVVVDRRVVLEEIAAQTRAEKFASLSEGQIVQGTVRSLTDFGAFVDLGGIDGLLHVSDMSWNRVGKPEEVVKTGDTIQVKVLKIQPDKKKISLGLKQLQQDPWTLAAETIKEGQRVKGKVARLTDFGAFVEILPGVDGLIHVSAMSWEKKIRKPSDMLTAGEMVEAVVLGVNLADKRISLSLKQALGDPWEEIVRSYPLGSVVERPITSVANFGVFVDLGGGIEGMIHVGDITREKRIEHPKEVLTNGQTVKAQVIELDSARRRVRLSIKALEPTSADHFIAEHNVGDTVSGRVVDLRKERAKVELGDGVTGSCQLASKEGTSEGSAASAPADISALSAMLSAKWKSGGGDAPGPGGLKTGQIRQFRISAMDAEKKRIDLELLEKA